MRFDRNTSTFCGNSCATSFDTGASWGLGLSFVKPFVDDDPKYKLEEVDTSKGKIYLKLRVLPTAVARGYYSEDHYGKDGARSLHAASIPTEIEHYTCSEVSNFDRYCNAPVGMCLLVENSPEYEKAIEREKKNLTIMGGDPYGHGKSNIAHYESYIKVIKELREKVEKSLEGILLYKSVPFYNLVHGERDYPSCTLYIYDKGMKNEV